ncbi:MAG: cellulase family glycosylhydrolase, partial [Planctomycetota bacterium]
WRRIAVAYGDEPDVWFGLMNEPHSMATEDWLTAANAAIAAIREAGAENRILVPGNAWTGAHSWSDDWYGTPNAEVMSGLVDPADRLVIEVHQYLDEDSSGTADTVVSATIGVERIAGFTQWCREYGFQAFLGETAVARSDDPDWVGYQAMDALLTQMAADDDVWIGWAWWAGGPWWGEYLFTLEPTGDGTDRPQMQMLAPHMPQTTAPGGRRLGMALDGDVALPRSVSLGTDTLQIETTGVPVFFEGRPTDADLRIVFGTATAGDG